MTNMYDDFEKRFTTSWFSSDWVEIDQPKEIQTVSLRKDIETLESELEKINEEIEKICEKQTMLANLAKFYRKDGAFN